MLRPFKPFRGVPPPVLRDGVDAARMFVDVVGEVVHLVVDDDPQIVHGRVSRDLISRVRRSWIDFRVLRGRARCVGATARRCARREKMHDDHGDERARDVERYDADVDAERSRQGVERGGGRHVETRERDGRSMTTRGAASADEKWM